MVLKLKKGDEILITAGKDKGKRGKIEKVFPKRASVLVPGLNVYKKHMKKRDEQNPGGIISFSRPLVVGNVSLICPKCGKQTRIGYSLEKNKKKFRICRKCKAKI
uniref:Large ribosomal subunit protein uL24 n=1 Tax=uncultured Microgenomates bacterium Rifle_16ft_4_minimus_22956 TaxID=1665109 RepID=A0A0H4T5F0_9BACT|nr:50S ribosomal protein L24, large subunit ribosomal protein L24 [uncultured Microgenomates bacterium Rifle_16ft_4_minimus_22956]